MNSSKLPGSARRSRNWPLAMPPKVSIMYTERSWPRVRLVAASLSQLSATMNRPEKQKPATMRKPVQPAGCTQRLCSSTTPEASEAIAANTRMWPTFLTKPGMMVEPAANPT